MMKTSKSNNTLEVKKIQITKIKNISLIRGGRDIIIIDDGTGVRSHRLDCPTETNTNTPCNA
jgi:hypothetical protein